jgi:hypothetical protein
LNPVGSDCPHRLPALLETSPRGAAACCALTGSPQATWHSASEVGGERFHVSLCVACLAPLYVESCGSDQHQHT